MLIVLLIGLAIAGLTLLLVWRTAYMWSMSVDQIVELMRQSMFYNTPPLAGLVAAAPGVAVGVGLVACCFMFVAISGDPLSGTELLVGRVLLISPLVVFGLSIVALRVGRPRLLLLPALRHHEGFEQVRQASRRS